MDAVHAPERGSIAFGETACWIDTADFLFLTEAPRPEVDIPMPARAGALLQNTPAFRVSLSVASLSLILLILVVFLFIANHLSPC
jgi:hypothetical protein